MKRMWVLAAVILLTGVARAADVDDARGALKKLDDAVSAGKWLDALGDYYTENPQEQELARAMIEMDAAVTRLDDAVRGKFADAGVAIVGPALHELPPGQYAAAQVDVADGVARATWKGGTEPVLLRKVNGVWKMSIPDVVTLGMKKAGIGPQQARDMEPQVLDLAVTRTRLRSSGLIWLSLEVASGKYATADEVKTAATAVMAKK